MIPRERELAAIRHELPDRISTDAVSIEIRPEIAAHLGIEQSEVQDALGIDGRMLGVGYLGETRLGPGGEELNEWGAEPAKDYGTSREYPLADATTIAQVEAHAWPDPRDYAYDRAAEAAPALGARHAVRGPSWQPVFCRVCQLFGMESALTKMVTHPRVIEAAAALITEITAEVCARLLDACGDAIPILWLGDDFATQRGLMMSPEHWRRLLKPHYARLFAVGKERGRFVWFHSCGDITPVLGDLIDIGMDVWETVQLHTLPMPAADLKHEYGRELTFFGGINTQRLPFATPAEVRDEVRRCIDVLGAGGGYICGPDHHIKPDVPPENAAALFDEARSFRRAGYTRDTIAK